MILALTAFGLLSAIQQSANSRPQEDGFVSLFDGKDLAGWKQFAGKEQIWTVEDGLLVCKGGGGGWLGTVRDYADFEIRLEYRLKPGGNSGVYIRAPQEGHISRVGMEIQILDDFHPKYAKIDFYQYTGSIYHVVPPTRRTSKPAGEWNSMTIRAQGRNVAVTLNGVKIVDADLDRCLQDPAVAKEHTGLSRKTGRIGLQSHTDRVEFRHIRLKELK
ncbi:MAG: DUF1080 domain-containing protein [Planctomycetes bacterium]|nr:DUF1080 domain-containing protein [Planctomycetota bacterium]